MARPDEFPDWATAGSNTVAPPTSLRTAGWAAFTAPPAQFFNWCQNLIGRWVRYLDDERAAVNTRIDNLVIPGEADFTGVAYKAQENAFTAMQSIAHSNASKPLLRSDAMPSGSGHAGNRWRPIFEFQITPGQFVGMHSGINGSDSAALALVSNATWDVAAERWKPYASGSPSLAVLWYFDRVRISVVAAGTATWLEWPHAAEGGLQVGRINAHGDVASTGDVSAATVHAGTITSGGEVHGLSVHSDGEVTAATMITAGSGLTVTAGNALADIVRARQRFEFEAPIYRETELDMSLGQAAGWSFESAVGVWRSTLGGELTLNLPLPHGAHLIGLDIEHSQQSGSNIFRLIAREATDWGSAGEPDLPSESYSAAVSSDTGWLFAHIEPAGGLNIDGGRKYTLLCDSGHLDPSDGNRFARVRMRWNDPGPSSY